MTIRQEYLIRAWGRDILFAEERPQDFNGVSACITEREDGLFLQTFDPSGERTPAAEDLCFAGKYLWDSGLRECPVTLHSKEGEHLILCSTCGEGVTAVTAGVGKASFVPKEVPLRFEHSLMNDPVSIEGAAPFRLTALRFRDPYAVVFFDTVGDCSLLERGKDMASMGLFPDGAEVLFAYVRGEKKIHLRAHHRDGSNDVRGNDVCAALAAAVAVGRCLPDTAVTVPLPDAEVRAVCTKDWNLFLTCPVSNEIT